MRDLPLGVHGVSGFLTVRDNLPISLAYRVVFRVDQRVGLQGLVILPVVPWSCTIGSILTPRVFGISGFFI